MGVKNLHQAGGVHDGLAVLVNAAAHMPAVGIMTCQSGVIYAVLSGGKDLGEQAL